MPESSPATPVALRPPQISLAPDACAVTAAMDAFAAGVAALQFYEPGALVGEVDAVDVVLVIVATSARLAAECRRDLFTAGRRVSR